MKHKKGALQVKTKTVVVSELVWRELQNIKFTEDWQTLDGVISHLLQYYKKGD